MDVEAALAAIREWITTYDTPEGESLSVDELVALVSGLDDWLSVGGRLPKAWHR